MCALDDLEPNDFLTPTTKVKEEHLDCKGDYCMGIEIRNVKIEDETDLNRRIEAVCRNKLFSFDLTSKEKCIFFDSKSGRKLLHNHLLVDALCKCAIIKGDSNSFAIIKFYRGNYWSGEATFIYEDFVTPGFTIDAIKFERFIKEKY